MPLSSPSTLAIMLLLLLVVLVHSRADGILGCKVFRKPTHTDLYLNNASFHYPAQKRTVLSILVQRANVVSDDQNIQLEHLKSVFRKNGNSPWDIAWPIGRSNGRTNRRAKRVGDGSILWGYVRKNRMPGREIWLEIHFPSGCDNQPVVKVS